jgi:hypothetical protein
MRAADGSYQLGKNTSAKPSSPDGGRASQRWLRRSLCENVRETGATTRMSVVDRRGSDPALAARELPLTERSSTCVNA